MRKISYHCISHESLIQFPRIHLLHLACGRKVANLREHVQMNDGDTFFLHCNCARGCEGIMANHSECCVCACLLFFMSVRSLHLNGNRGSKLPPGSSSAITAAYYNYAGGEFPQNHPTVSLRVWPRPREWIAGCAC